MTSSRPSVGLMIGSLVLAFALWYAVFGWGVGIFWVKIALAAAVLASISLAAMGSSRVQLEGIKARDVKLGLASAVLLYVVFWLGKLVLTALFPDVADSEIGRVYAPRSETSLWIIGALLLFVTGPSEEIYWRGYLQRVLMQRIGPASGWLLATLAYSLVHVWTLNIPLMLAAFTAGLVWGWIYLVERRLLPVIISHAVWSVAIFVVLPVH